VTVFSRQANTCLLAGSNRIHFYTREPTRRTPSTGGRQATRPTVSTCDYAVVEMRFTKSNRGYNPSVTLRVPAPFTQGGLRGELLQSLLTQIQLPPRGRLGETYNPSVFSSQRTSAHVFATLSTRQSPYSTYGGPHRCFYYKRVKIRI